MQVKVTMEGKGKVRQPDGTEREITIRADRLMTPEEAEKYGYHPGKQRSNSGPQRGL